MFSLLNGIFFLCSYTQQILTESLLCASLRRGAQWWRGKGTQMKETWPPRHFLGEEGTLSGGERGREEKEAKWLALSGGGRAPVVVVGSESGRGCWRETL